MIRPALLVWLLLIGAAGGLSFHVSYGVLALEDELARRNRAILEAQESIRVLRAEWAFLNHPARLRQLADELGGLEPIRPEQLTTRIADLPFPTAPGEAPAYVAMAGIDGIDMLPLPVRKPGDGGAVAAAPPRAPARTAPAPSRPALTIDAILASFTAAPGTTGGTR